MSSAEAGEVWYIACSEKGYLTATLHIVVMLTTQGFNIINLSPKLAPQVSTTPNVNKNIPL